MRSRFWSIPDNCGPLCLQDCAFQLMFELCGGPLPLRSQSEFLSEIMEAGEGLPKQRPAKCSPHLFRFSSACARGRGMAAQTTPLATLRGADRVRALQGFVVFLVLLVARAPVDHGHAPSLLVTSRKQCTIHTTHNTHTTQYTVHNTQYT